MQTNTFRFVQYGEMFLDVITQLILELKNWSTSCG